MTVTAETACDARLNELVEEFLQLLNTGSGVPVRQFAARYPDLAEQIVAEFPGLLIARGLKLRPPSPSSLREAPELIAGYRIVRQIGQGGHGTVYEAERSGISRRLAVKVLPELSQDRTLVDRFRRDAEAAARLDHPNIVAIFDHGEQNGLRYLAMPLIDGRSLDRLLEDYRNGRPLEAPLIGRKADFRKLASLATDIASALAYAHGIGTIHRKIQPRNLLLDSSGKIRISDFGLGKIEGADADSVRYLAPELALGMCDGRSDIYSLGITLYELASGTPVWSQCSAAELQSLKAGSEVPDIATHAGFVPTLLARIIMKACHRRPEDRYQSAEELRDALVQFLDTGTSEDRHQGRSPMLTSRLLMGISCGIAVVTVAALFIAPRMQPGSRESAAEIQPEEVPASQATSLAVSETPEEPTDSVDATTADENPGISPDHVEPGNDPAEIVAQPVHELDVPAAVDIPQTPVAIDEAKAVPYDTMDHPLTNAIRHLDLARRVTLLRISDHDKQSGQNRMIVIGEAIRRRIVSPAEIRALLALLPEDAQRGPTKQTVTDASMLRFLMLLKEAFEAARVRQAITQKKSAASPDRASQQSRRSVEKPRNPGRHSAAEVPTDGHNSPQNTKKNFRPVM